MIDLISRQAAIDALKVAYWDNDIQAAKDDPCVIDAMTDWAIRQIKALQSAERHGRWVEADDDGTMDKCSVCGELSCCRSPYCGECGAKMDEVDKSECVVGCDGICEECPMGKEKNK